MSNLEKLKRLLIKPSNFEYFIRNVEDPAWFDTLNKDMKTFSHIPEPKQTKDGKYIQFERWWPAQYLIKVADKIPEKVAGILTLVKTDNRFVIDDAMQAILKMPVWVSKTLLMTISQWFNAKYRGLIDHYSIELFQKFLSEKEYEGAVKLFDILATVVPEKVHGESFRYEVYHFKELQSKHLPKLIEARAKEVLCIAEKWLKTAIKINKGDSKTDFSTLWRSAIEPHPQNWDHNDVKDILADVVRDALATLCRVDPPDGEKTITAYLTEGYSIFRRIALHVLRVTDVNKALTKNIIKDKKYLSEHDLRHEFLFLVREKIDFLTEEEKNEFFASILRVITPAEEKRENPEKLSRHESFKILSVLKSSLSGRDDLFRILSVLEKVFGEEEYPDIEAPHFSWSGPESPKNKEELSKWTPEQFLKYVSEEFKPEKVDWDPSPEGLSRIFEEVVQENPEPYAKMALHFFDPKKIYPAYPTGLISGLEKACKEKKKFPLDAVLELCEALIETVGSDFDEKLETRRDEFSFGTFAWARGAIGSFFDDLLRQETFEISNPQMGRIKNIIFKLIESDPDPTIENEEKYGGDNMDFVTYCINCNRGKAMRAMMQYALRWARTCRSLQEREAEKEKGPFPPGSRFGKDVREFLDKRLCNETSPSVQSVFGFFLPYLYYLDKNWVREKKDEGLLFPKDPTRQMFWKAHWDGFIGFSNFHREIFEFLKEDFKKAIDELSEAKTGKGERYQYRMRLAEHLMIAYWHEIEKYEHNSLIDLFFQNADEETRGHAVGFLGEIYEGQKPTRDLSKWKLLRVLWEKRKDIKDSEIADFVRWLPCAPEGIEKLSSLMKPMIPYLHLGYQEEEFLNYIDRNVEAEPKLSMELLVELFKIKQSLINIHFRHELIRRIIEKAKTDSQSPMIIGLVNDAVNRLAEMGYYEYRDLPIKRE